MTTNEKLSISKNNYKWQNQILTPNKTALKTRENFFKKELDRNKSTVHHLTKESPLCYKKSMTRIFKYKILLGN